MAVDFNNGIAISVTVNYASILDVGAFFDPECVGLRDIV